jgi:DNA-binding transcriptional LysR family regulator
MRTVHIENVDLNLLPSLIALLDEKQVSRAAQRVGLSQPAMSRALQRLRRALNDELLVRNADGYWLTPRAERIRAQLATIVPRLNSLFADDDFDPRETAQTFQLAGTDYAVNVFGSRLFQRIFSQSPHSTVRFHPWHDGVFAQIDRGDLDLVFFGARAPAHLSCEQLFTDRFVCLVAPAHPLAQRSSLDLGQYLECQHLVIDIGDGEQPAVDRVLKRLGTPRRAALTVPFHALAPATIAGTQLVATMPSRLVAGLVDDSQVRALQAPREIDTMSYYMAWHPRLDGDRGHSWLRDSVRGSCTR